MKKAFRLKLFEICKTGAKKSSPDMFKFYVVSAGADKVTDAGKANTCSRTIQSTMTTSKSAKNERPFKNMGFNRRTV